MMLFKNNRGVSLVEALVAIGLLGAVGMMTMHLTKQTTKTTLKTDFDSEVSFVVNEMNGLLFNTDNCKATFWDYDNEVPILTPNFIVNKVDSWDESVDPAKPIVDDGRKIYQTVAAGGEAGHGYSKFRVVSYSLTPSIPGDGQDWSAKLTITFQNRKALTESANTEEFTREVGLYVDGDLSDSDNPIIRACYGLGYAPIWSRAGQQGPEDANKIFYSTPLVNGFPVGNVRIGIDQHNSGSFLIEQQYAQYYLVVNGIAPDETAMYIHEGLTAQMLTYISDRRLKDNIETIENPLDKLTKLRGVTFDWRRDGRRDVGLIAQEVQEQLPEIVHPDGSERHLNVDYGKTVALLIEALKEQQSQIEGIKERIKTLK